MGFINPFQIYSKGENTITNNILLLLSNLYRINPKIYELFINSVLPENINYEVIPVFTQQKSQKEGGIIDGHIQTKATKIIIETKITGLDNTKKLINYCKNENLTETNILIHISDSTFDETTIKSINQKIGIYNFNFVSITFSELLSSLQEITEEYPFNKELYRLSKDFYYYCSSMDLIKNVFRIVPCNKSFELNEKYHLYFQPESRGYSNHQFTGIYTAKEVKYIGKVNKVFLAELTKEGKLITEKISGNGEITTEEENRIISTIKEFPEIYGYGDISKGHIFFLFDDNDFCPTKFKKTSKYGLLGSRLFDLKVNLEIENVERLSTLEIAEKLNDITW
ncbi:hypothetical protein JMUB3935_1713 [Leptotrichia trevisanii]|uniref:Uncharacterized protein n=1 Tax=Leptotrichia trevisanii TaxID=109328 RepID=A0A510KRT6_9FUSO|nr:hypothetical protein [Leptotrichia trevisanii]BBM52733.1 hypothetical protein JMUB3935_1713 [Leptotrichia trevisanii]